MSTAPTITKTQCCSAANDGLLIPLVCCNREASLPGHLTRQLSHHVSGANARYGRVHQGAVASRDAHLHLPTTWPECVQRGFPQLHWAWPHWAIHHGGTGAGRWGCVHHQQNGFLGSADWLLAQIVSFSFSPWEISPLCIQLPLVLCQCPSSTSTMSLFIWPWSFFTEVTWAMCACTWAWTENTDVILRHCFGSVAKWS